MCQGACRTVYIQTFKGYTTGRWQGRAVCCGLMLYLPLTVCVPTRRHASGYGT
jgi:hypothetical protein